MIPGAEGVVLAFLSGLPTPVSRRVGRMFTSCQVVLGLRRICTVLWADLAAEAAH